MEVEDIHEPVLTEVDVLCPNCHYPRRVSYVETGEKVGDERRLNAALYKLKCDDCGLDRDIALQLYVTAYRQAFGYLPKL